jgi:ribosomal protein S1
LTEGWALASNLPSHLSSDIIHWTQVRVGQVLTVKIVSILDFGLVVKISDRVQAICPAIHVSDIPVSGKLQKKFKKDQKLTVRVWEVKDSAIIVTNKKTIVEDEAPLLSIDDAEEGDASVGVVSRISTDGIDVHFFNSIKGTIPFSMLIKQGVVDPDEAYRQGQVLKCIVMSKVISPNYKGKSKSKAKSVLILGLDIGKKTGKF